MKRGSGYENKTRTSRDGVHRYIYYRVLDLTFSPTPKGVATADVCFVERRHQIQRKAHEAELY